MIAVVGVAQWCAFHADIAEKMSRAGASGKLESAISGNLAGLDASVYSRSGCALVA